MLLTVIRKYTMTKKVHGKPYIVGDLVWLFSSVVPSGQPRKLHHPWSGTYRVIAKLSETDYRVKKSLEEKPSG